MRLASLFDALSAVAAQQPSPAPLPAAARDYAAPSSTASVPGSRERLSCSANGAAVPYPGVSCSLASLLCASLPALQPPQLSSAQRDCSAVEDSGARECSVEDSELYAVGWYGHRQLASSFPLSAAQQRSVWPPHRWAQCEVTVDTDCFDLPASPSPFLQAAAFCPHSAALTALSDCVHSSAWGGLWQWSSVDGSLHLHQHVSAGWSSARLAPRAVRPLSSWTDFHRGNTQHSMHHTYSSSDQQAQQQPTARKTAPRDIQRAAAVDTQHLFPFDPQPQPAATSEERQRDVLTTAPVIGVEVSAAAHFDSDGGGERQRDGSAAVDNDKQHLKHSPATATPYRVHSTQSLDETPLQPTQRRDKQSGTERAEEEVNQLAAHHSIHLCLRPLSPPLLSTAELLVRLAVADVCSLGCALLCQAGSAPSGASTAPPDLAETALLLEWETQWRQTALQQRGEAPAGKESSSDRRGGGSAPSYATSDGSRSTRFSGDGQGTYNKLPCMRPARLDSPMAAFLSLYPALSQATFHTACICWLGPCALWRALVCVCVCVCVSLSDDELDRLLAADEWVDGSQRSGSQS